MTRSNIDRARAVALSLHPWNNRPEDWQRLRDVVFRLGRSCPKAAKDCLSRHDARNAALPNAFAEVR